MRYCRHILGIEGPCSALGRVRISVTAPCDHAREARGLASNQRTRVRVTLVAPWVSIGGPIRSSEAPSSLGWARALLETRRLRLKGVIAGAARRSSTTLPTLRRGFNSPHPLHVEIAKRSGAELQPPSGRFDSVSRLHALVQRDSGGALLRPMPSVRFRASAPSPRHVDS